MINNKIDTKNVKFTSKFIPLQDYFWNDFDEFYRVKGDVHVAYDSISGERYETTYYSILKKPNGELIASNLPLNSAIIFIIKLLHNHFSILNKFKGGGIL